MATKQTNSVFSWKNGWGHLFPRPSIEGRTSCGTPNKQVITSGEWEGGRGKGLKGINFYVENKLQGYICAAQGIEPIS